MQIFSQTAKQLNEDINLPTERCQILLHHVNRQTGLRTYLGKTRISLQ